MYYKPNPESKQEALRLLGAGYTPSEVAQSMGLNPNTIRGWASKAGPEFQAARQNAFERRIAAGSHTARRLTQDTTPDGGNAGWNPAAKSTRRKPTHLVIPDTQCKPGENLDHLLWAGRYAADRKPDVIIHLGDHWDMPSLSSYEKRGSKWFEGRRILEDIEAGNRGLALFEEGLGDFRPSRMVLLRGNHEDRITRFLNENPQQEGLVGMELFNDIGWEVVEYLTPITIDGVTYSHYFYNPNTGRSYSGSVDTMLRNIGFTFTMGHQQGLRWGRRELINGSAQIGLVAGSYYQHDEEYRGPQARSEWRGLVVKHEVGGGDYDPMFVSLDFLKERYG